MDRSHAREGAATCFPRPCLFEPCCKDAPANQTPASASEAYTCM